MLSRSTYLSRDALLKRIMQGGDSSLNTKIRSSEENDTDDRSSEENDTDDRSSEENDTDDRSSEENDTDDRSGEDNDTDDSDSDESENQKYQYLSNGELSQIFGDIEDTSIERVIFICPYVIDNTCNTPFIKFATQISADRLASFPSIKFQCPIFPSDGNDSDQQTHEFFMNACVEHLMEIIPAHEVLTPEILQEMYKGFTISKNDTEIFVFFNCSSVVDIYSAAELPTEMRWVLTTHPFDISATAMFAANPALSKLQTIKTLRNIDPPLMLYPCSSDSTNMFDVGDKEKIISLIQVPVETTAFFGRAHIFTVIPIDITLPNIVAYAVFLETPKYIVKDAIENLGEDEIEEFADRAETLNAGAVYFYRNNRQHWAVKSPDHFTRI